MKNSILALAVTLCAFNCAAQIKSSQNETFDMNKIMTALGQNLSQQKSIINSDHTQQFQANPALAQKFLLRDNFLKNQKMGGGDAGGGNLLLGKILENNRMNVDTSPEMLQVKKLFSHIGTFEADSIDTEVQYVINKKSWYVLPPQISLPTLSSSQIGVSFSTDQGALQDFEEIWIDGQKYTHMSFDERVQLLAHEVFMGLKIFSFESYSRQCLVNTPLGTDCLRLQGYTDRKALNITADDYQEIRKATGVVLQNKELLTTNEITKKQINPVFQEIFEDGEFDSYYRQPSVAAYENKSFTDNDILDSLRNQSSAGKLPSYCNFKIVEDLGNHKYRMKPQIYSDIAFAVVKNEVFFKVTAKEIKSGKIVINNLYFFDLDKKETQDLTLNFSMGVPGYTASYMSGVQPASVKDYTKNYGLGMIAAGITTDQTVTSIAFGTFNNVKNNVANFSDAKDILECFQKPEYICTGPTCLTDF